MPVAKLLAQLDHERATLQQEKAALQARGNGGSQPPVPRAVFFQQVRQWVRGTTLSSAGYEDNGAAFEVAGVSEHALTAPVPAELHAFLFQVKRRLVRELVSAVYVGPDGSGVIVFRADGSRHPVQVTAQPPKMMARSLKRKMKSA